MAIVARQYADFGGIRTIDASGISDFNFPTTCNSLMLYLHPNMGDPFWVTLNFTDVSQGPDASWNRAPVMLPAGVILTIPNYEIDSFRVESTVGSQFSYWGFVTPGDAPYVSYTYNR